MYTIEDELFQQARAVVSSLARELSSQRGSGPRRPIGLQELVRRCAPIDLPEDGEAAYLQAIADKLEKCFPINELFPRRRRAGTS